MLRLFIAALLVSLMLLLVPSEILFAAGPPYQTIRVRSFHLDVETDARELDQDGNYIPCTQGDTAYGCGYTLVNGSYIRGYPYPDSIATLNIETEYLPNVIPFETNPGDGFGSTSLRAQSVAARTYSYYFSDHPVHSTFDLNNSAEKQYFQANGRYTMRPAHPNSDAAIAATSGYYVATSDKVAIFAEFGADHDPNNSIPEYVAPAYYTNSGDKFYLASVYDPISNGEDDNPKGAGHGRGLSQQGAKKWGRGYNTANERFPVWDYTKILAHYYTGINMYVPNGSGGYNPAWGPFRWNMIRYTPANDTYYAGDTKSISMRIQNSGINTWESGTRLVYWLKRIPNDGPPTQIGPFIANTSIPSRSSGQDVEISASITLPSSWYMDASYTYQIIWDLQRPDQSYFTSQGWTAQEWAIKVRKHVSAPIPPPPCSRPPCAQNISTGSVIWDAVDHPDLVNYRWRRASVTSLTGTTSAKAVQVPLEVGMNEVYVQTMDTTEPTNKSVEVKVFEALYDPVPPTLNSTSAPLAPWSNAQTLALTWAGSDDLSGIQGYSVEQQVNGGLWAIVVANSTATQYTTGVLANNTDYAFRITALDWAGNTKQIVLSTTVDRDPPSSVLTTPIGAIGKTWAFLRWNSTSDRAPITKYTIDRLVGGTWQTWRVVSGSSMTLLEGQPSTTYSFRIRAEDAAGNNESPHAGADITFTTGTDTSGISRRYAPGVYKDQPLPTADEPYPLPTSP